MRDQVEIEAALQNYWRLACEPIPQRVIDRGEELEYNLILGTAFDLLRWVLGEEAGMPCMTDTILETEGSNSGNVRDVEQTAEKLPVTPQTSKDGCRTKWQKQQQKKDQPQPIPGR